MSTRRDFLRIGGSIFGGLYLPQLLAATGGVAKNCIVYFQDGGACQHDFFDPKPDQPKLGQLEWKLQIPAGETKELVYRTRRQVYRQAPGPVG